MEDKVAESAVLSAILRTGYNAYDEVADLINANSFTDPTNQAIFRCAEEIFSNDSDATIDYPLLMSTAEDLHYKFLNKPTETKYIRALNNMPVGTNIAKLAVKVKTLQIRRELVGVIDEVKHNLITGEKTLGIEEILGLVEQPIFDFTTHLNNPQDDLKHISDGIDEWMDHIIAHPCEKIGISSGLDYYDEAIGGGFRRKSISIIGARSKQGKSILANFFCMKVGGIQKIPVLFLDTEMETVDHWSRMLASMTGVLQTQVQSGAFSYDPADKVKVLRAKEKLKKANITYKAIPGASIDIVMSNIRRWVRKDVGVDENGRTNDCLIVYDYLKLVNSSDINSNTQEYQAIGFMMTALHNFAHRYDVPIVTFTQLNRDGIEKESAAVVSQSDRIIWFGSSFAIFKDKTPEEVVEDGGRDGGNKKLIVVLSRHGPGMNGNHMNIQFDGHYTRITPAKTQREIHDDKRAKPGEFHVPSEIPFE